MSNKLTNSNWKPGESRRACYRAICDDTGTELTTEQATYFKALCNDYDQAMGDLARVGVGTDIGPEVTRHIAEQVQKYLSGETDATGILRQDIVGDRQRRKQLLKGVADAISAQVADFAEPIREEWVKSAKQFLAKRTEGRREEYAEFGLVFDGDPMIGHIESCIALMDQPIPRHLGRMARPHNFLLFADFEFNDFESSDE